MPIIPPYVPSGTNLDPSDLYDSSLYDPTGPTGTPHTMEVLNGGLDKDNYIYTAENKLQAWQIQEGAFFRGYYTGFDRPEFISSQQTGNKDIEENWIDHPGMAQKFFLPWEASVVMYGFQGFFRQDCSVWESNVSSTDAHDPYLILEAWYVQATVDNDTKSTLVTKLPYNRICKATANEKEFSALGDAEGDSSFWEKSDFGEQPIIGASNDIGKNGLPGVRTPESIGNPRRWRWVSKQGMLKNLSKGYHDFRVRVWVDALAPRPDFEMGARYNNRATNRRGNSGFGAAGVMGVTTGSTSVEDPADTITHGPFVSTENTANFWIVPVPECKLTTMSGAIWIMAMR